MLARADQAATETRSYLGDLADERRARPRDDLIGALVTATAERLNPDEPITMAALVFAAGFETATHLLGNGLVALRSHTAQLSRLLADPGRVAEPAVNELLRFDSPVQIARRKALRPMTIGGTEVRAAES